MINPVQSARLRTTGTFNFKYGRLEVEAKLPKGVRASPSVVRLFDGVIHGWMDGWRSVPHSSHATKPMHTGLAVAGHLAAAREERIRAVAGVGGDRRDGVAREQARLHQGCVACRGGWLWGRSVGRCAGTRASVRDHMQGSSRPAKQSHLEPAPSTTGGYDSFGSCMHWGPYFAQDAFELTCQSYSLPKGQGTFNDDFHVFGLYWDEVRACRLV